MESVLSGVRLVATGTALAVSTSPDRAVPSLGPSPFGIVMLGLDRSRLTMRGCSWLVGASGGGPAIHQCLTLT
jgi:hypothetical protein